MKCFGIGLVAGLVSLSSGQVYYELHGASNAVTVAEGDAVEYGYADELTKDIVIPVTWADSVSAKFYVDEYYPDGSVFRRSALYGVRQVGTTSRGGTFNFIKGGTMLPYGSVIPVYDFYHSLPAAPMEPSSDCEYGSTRDPIDTRNGSNYFTEKRIYVPCPGVSLKLDLNYQSVTEAPTGSLGKGWRHSLEWYLDVKTNRAVLYTDDGRIRVFENVGSGGYLPPFGKNWTLEEVASGYEMGMPGGLYYDFNTSGILSMIHDAWGNTLELDYGTNACLEHATHSNGRQVEFSNDWHEASAQWRTASISVREGMSLTFDYNSDGQLTQVLEQVGANSYTSSYHYADSFLTNKVDGAGFHYSFKYGTGTNGLLNGQGIYLDVDGYYKHEVEYLYPDLTEVRYSQHGKDQIYRYYRDREGVLATRYGPGASISNALTRGVNYSYSLNSEDRTEETLFDHTAGTTWSRWMLYDGAHNMTNISVGYGTTNPVHQLTMEYDPLWHLPSAVVDAADNRIEIVYTNGSPAVFKAFYSASNSYYTSFGYATNGLIQAVINANEHATTFRYDEMGNLTMAMAEIGPAITNTYDALGFLESMATITKDGAPTGRIMRYETDTKGRVLQAIYPDGLSASFTYNSLDYLTNIIDRAGRSTDFAYAPNEKLISITRYLNTSGSNVPVRVEYDLDEQVNLLRISEPRGRFVESYKLDIQDRVTSVTNIEDQVMSIDYTIGGFVDQITRFDGSIIEYTYDTAGQKSGMVYLRGSQTNVVVRFTHFTSSQPESVTDGFSTVSNAYNRLNRLTNVASSAGNTSFDVHYAHDPAGNVTNIVASFNNPSITDLITEFTYDAAERISGVSRNGIETQQFVYTYSPLNGLVDSLSNTVSGICCSYQYDLMDRITNITYRAGNGTVIHAFEYEYNAMGMIERKSTSGGSDFTSVEYTYDSIDRLVYESSITDGLPTFSKSYSFDLADNRISEIANGLKTTYTLGSGNRLDASSTAAVSNTLFVSGAANEPIGTDNRWGELWITNLTLGAGTKPSVNGNSFFAEIAAAAGQYNTIHAAIRDRAGNMGYAAKDYWVRTDGGVTSASSYAYNPAGCLTNFSGVLLEWDERYRLKSADTASGCVEYEYDVLNRRVSRMEGSRTNYFVYDGIQIIADLDGAGNLLRTYVWGMGTDNLLSLTDHATTNTYYAIKDHQNTVIALVDESGSTVESYDYDAYGTVLAVKDGSGNLTGNQQSALGNRYAFQGREIDWSTGLYYFRTRWYDPETGRWLSKDPIGINGGLNQYEFCVSNPVNMVDPTGLLVEIHSRYVNGTGRLGAHTYITVTDLNGTVNTWGSYKINDRNEALHNHPSDVGTPRTSSITVFPPRGMTQSEWDNAVNLAGQNRVNNQHQVYKLFGGDNNVREGNCHKTTRGILNDAGGRVPRRYNPPGLNPGLHP